MQPVRTSNGERTAFFSRLDPTRTDKLLSCRMVHFEQYEMIWECRDSIMRCECEELDGYHAGFAREYKTDMENEASKGMFTTWHKVVNEYYNRALTHASDFLPALSGIVKRSQMFGAGESLAGLWACNPHDEMLWYISMSRTSKPWTRAQPFRAPTWSWASLVRPLQENVDDTVIRHSNHYAVEDPITSLCRVLTASCTPSGHDKNGAVSSGEVKLRGVLMRIDKKYAEDSPDICYGVPLDKLSRSPWLDCYNSRALFSFDTWETPRDYEMYAFIIKYNKYAQMTPVRYQFKGLVLRAVSHVDNVFERVGHWEMRSRAAHGEESSEQQRQIVEDEIDRDLESAANTVVTII